MTSDHTSLALHGYCIIAVTAYYFVWWKIMGLYSALQHYNYMTVWLVFDWIFGKMQCVFIERAPRFLADILFRCGRVCIEKAFLARNAMSWTHKVSQMKRENIEWMSILERFKRISNYENLLYHITNQGHIKSMEMGLQVYKQNLILREVNVAFVFIVSVSAPWACKIQSVL